MQYGIPPKPTQIVEYVIGKPFSSIVRRNTSKDDPFNAPAAPADNFGGIFIPVSGTAMSGSATLTNYSLVYIPQVGPLPEVEMSLHQEAKNMEQIVELRITDKSLEK